MNILSDLGVPSPAAPVAPADQAAPAKQPTEDPVISKIMSGEVPGVYVPEGAQLPQPVEGVTPESLARVGVLLYKPKTPGISVVAFNSKLIPARQLRDADLAGKLTEILPPVTDLLPDTGSDVMGDLAPVAEDVQPATPNRVPVMPRPSLGAGAQQKLAGVRAESAAGAENPSERPIAGGGVILNGLLKRTI
ncbi:MAG TPA: hypothetical protein VEH04_16740 [Verrucomicrobiae bacterium]|nr:hypothetical protein [Verrucomicrobiae bacterium]